MQSGLASIATPSCSEVIAGSVLDLATGLVDRQPATAPRTALPITLAAWKVVIIDSRGGGFTPQVQQNIQGMTGSPEMRQYAAGGVNAPLFMKDSPLNGNAFAEAVQNAKASGASTFEVGGKTYNVK